MIKAHCCATWFAILLGLPAWAQSTDSIGMVKSSTGAVVVDRAGNRLPAPVGTTVQAGDRVRTGGDGSVGIMLKDDTRLSAGPNSVLLLDEFIFDPTTHQGKMTATVKKGTLAVVTGKLAKKMPESVKFHTPTTVLGVRGTEFVVEVPGSGEE